MSWLIPEAAAQEAGAASQGGDPMITMLLLGLMFVFMYFMIIRPQRKRQKEHESLVQNISKGDEIVLASGMLGKVVRVDDSYVVIDTGTNIELKFQKMAVHGVLPKGTLKNI